MKKIMFCAVMLFTLNAYAGPATQETILKKFKETFPTAQTIKWYNADNYYEVSFINKEISQRIYYDLDGNVFRTIRYYDENILSPYIAQRIKEKYKNKLIRNITEIQDDSGILYQVVLQDEKHLYVVNCNYMGEMSLQNKFIKG